MHYKHLGTTGLHISTVGFGCMSLKTGEADAEKLIGRAVDLGINYFDTADLYDKGLNEQLVGKALQECRREVILSTKVGNRWRADGSGWDWNPRKDYILQAADESLRRLGTNHIDLYLLHGGTILDPIDETIEAFEWLVQQGKIRHYGISSIRPNVIREWVHRSNIVAVMTQYSLLDRRPEEAVLPMLQEKGISVLVRGSVAQGLLVDKPAKDYLNYEAGEVQAAAAAVASVSHDHRSAAQTAIQFVLNHPAVTSAVVGIRTMEQLEEAANTIKTPLLTPDELERLHAAVPKNHYTEHR